MWFIYSFNSTLGTSKGYQEIPVHLATGAWTQIDGFNLVEESDETDNTEYIEPPVYWTLPASSSDPK